MNTTAALALLFVVCAVFVAARFRVDGSMATLLPPASQKAALLAREVIDSSVSRGMILSVGAAPMTEESKRRSRSVAKTLAIALSDGSDRHFAFVSAGPGNEWNSRALTPQRLTNFDLEDAIPAAAFRLESEAARDRA